LDITLGRVLGWLKIPIWIIGGLSGILAFLLIYEGFKGKRELDYKCKAGPKKRILLTAVFSTILLIWWVWGRNVIGSFLPVFSELMTLTLTLFCILVLIWMLFPKK